MLSIKRADITEIPLIRELTMQVWPQTHTSILGPVQVGYMLDTMYNDAELARQMVAGQQYIICFDDEIPEGFASYSQTEALVFKLNKIYILPEQQGKGIGRFMLDYIIKDIASVEANALDLNVNRYNYSAQSFYEKFGFKVLKEEDIDIGGGYFMNDYVLRYSL